MSDDQPLPKEVFIAAAKVMLHDEGFDVDRVVSRYDRGAWVRCWVWVDNGFARFVHDATEKENAQSTGDY